MRAGSAPIVKHHKIIWYNLPEAGSYPYFVKKTFMSPDKTPTNTKICPTCGTRLSENATRCLVCGTELTAKASAPVKKAEKSALQAGRMPEITLSLPAALGALVVVLLIGAAVVFGALRASNRVVDPTAVPTATDTPTVTPTATEFYTVTPSPTVTPLPPIEY